MEFVLALILSSLMPCILMVSACALIPAILFPIVHLFYGFDPLVEIESARKTTLLTSGTCRVCGEEFAGRPVHTCGHCATPHHDDCWSYNHGCAVYACKGGNTVAAVMLKEKYPAPVVAAVMLKERPRKYPAPIERR